MSAAKKSSSLVVSSSVLSSLRPAKNISSHEGASVTSLDFDDSGQYLLSAGVDKTIQLYDCYKGVHQKEVQSQKYGAHLARFSHHDLNCLYASTPAVGAEDADHSIRYLSLKTKAYLRYFRGHSDQVISLEVNPVSETFVSASLDHTVKLWDLRTSTPMGNIEVGQHALVAYDPHGIVFGVAKPPLDGALGSVCLYDVTSFERGPFSSQPIKARAGEKWTRMEFSNNGKYILVATDSAVQYVLDAMSGVVIANLNSSANAHWTPCQYTSSASSCFTPDGKFVVAGSPDGSVSVFDLSVLKRKELIQTKRIQDLAPVAVLPSDQGMSRVVAFNPKLLTLATADSSVVLWGTDHDD